MWTFEWIAGYLGKVREIWHRLMSQVIAEVPDDIVVCEFDCRKYSCTLGEWETCERRKSFGNFATNTSQATSASPATNNPDQCDQVIAAQWVSSHALENLME
jgi:hypothetical protein